MNTKKTILVLVVIFLVFAVSFSGTVLVGQFSDKEKPLFKINGLANSDNEKASEATKKTSDNKKEKSEKNNKSASEKASQKSKAKENASQAASSKNSSMGDTAQNNTPQNNNSQENDNQGEDNAHDGNETAPSESNPSDNGGGSSSETASSESDNGQNPTLSMILKETGHSFDELKEKKCSQLIIVDSNGNTAQLSMFEKDEKGIWNNKEELSAPGYVGAAGVSSKSYEGSWQTPAGLFPVGQAFYINDKPKTGLEAFQITSNTYWVDDPNSEYYNQRVESEGAIDWNSAEHMIDIQNYKYGFVINFNMSPIVKEKGSAIFFHISSSPTAGCVGTAEDMVLKYLEVLDKNKNPYILTF